MRSLQAGICKLSDFIPQVVPKLQARNYDFLRYTMKLPTRKLVAVLSGALGIGGGAAMDEQVMDLISKRIMQQHVIEDHGAAPEVSLAPQCTVTVKVDEDFFENHCRKLR